MNDAKRNQYVIIRDCSIGRPEVYILENATTDELHKYVKWVVNGERNGDIANGWKSSVKCNEKGLDYTITTKTSLGRHFTTRISVAETVCHKIYGQKG